MIGILKNRGEKTGGWFEFLGERGGEQISGGPGGAGGFGEVEPLKSPLEQHPGSEGFDRQVKVVAGLAEADVETVVAGDFRIMPAAARGVVLEDTVAPARIGMIAPPKALGAGGQHAVLTAQIFLEHSPPT
jgi:hypothetical protein